MTEILERAYWLDDSTALCVEELGSLDEWGLEQYSLARLEEPFGDVTDKLDQMAQVFNVLGAAKTPGVVVRQWLQIFGEVAEKVTKSKNATKAAQDAAYAVLYELKSRPELQSSEPVPLWLMKQLHDRVRALLVGASKADRSLTAIAIDQAVVLGKKVGGLVDDAKRKAREAMCNSPLGWFNWSCFSTPKKIAVGAVGVVVLYGLYKILLAGAPIAMEVAKARVGLRGLPRRQTRYLPVLRRRRSW